MSKIMDDVERQIAEGAARAQLRRQQAGPLELAEASDDLALKYEQAGNKLMGATHRQLAAAYRKIAAES